MRFSSTRLGPGVTRLRSSALGLACLIATSACSYVHSPGRLQLATDARNEFDELRKDPPYAAETARFQSHYEQVSEVSREIHTLNTSVQTLTLANKTLGELVTATQETKATVQADLATAKQQLADAETKTKDDLVALGVADQSVADAEAALDQAEEKVHRYAATQILLRGAVSTLLSDDKPDVDALLATLDESVPGAGDNATVKSVLGVKKNDIQKLRKLKNVYGSDDANKKEKAIAFKDAVAALPGIRTSAKKLADRITFEAPGAVTVLLGLGLDVAKSKRDYLKAEVEHAKRLIKLRKQQVKDLEKLTADLDRDLDTGAGAFGLAAAAAALDANTPIQDLGRQLIADAEAEDPNAARQARGKLQGLLVVVARNFDVRVVRQPKQELATDNIQALETERDLERAIARLREREAFISRGLEGLVEFHNGGFKPEHAEMILQAAEALGIMALIGAPGL